MCGFRARDELVHEVGETTRVVDVGEVPGAVEQLETAAGQSLVTVNTATALGSGGRCMSSSAVVAALGLALAAASPA